MRNQENIFRTAVLARDARFDGKFFFGVRTTGIYCRPICPARAKPENMEFFLTPVLAEQAGYRPCLRCRPECAPLSPGWIGTSATVQRALKLMGNTELISGGEDVFAERLGMSARHLRRLFKEEIGKTPKQIHDHSRLGFAKTLILETPMPLTEIAFSSGFSSIRRFNDAFRARFDCAPSALRRGASAGEAPSSLQLTLSYRPPFDWTSLLAFFRAHAVSGVEAIDETSYGRVFKIGRFVGGLRISNDAKHSRLGLSLSVPNSQSILPVVHRTRQMFDLDSDPIHISSVFSKNRFMSRLCKKHPGLRLPAGWDPYESAISAILGQFVSVKHAKELVKDLVERYGTPVTNPLDGKPGRLFPSPEVLAKKKLSRVRTTQARRDTIREFSRQVAEGMIRLDSAQDPGAFRDRLLSIKGIGPWTAEYISLRSLGDPDAFPSGDLILRRVLEQRQDLNVDAFRPWRAYAAIYLWREFA